VGFTISTTGAVTQLVKITVGRPRPGNEWTRFFASR
jgi:hypothetical protein